MFCKQRKMSTLSLFILIGYCGVQTEYSQQCSCYSSFIPHGYVYNDIQLDKDDDYFNVSTSRSFYFRGRVYSRLYVSTNGIISFGEGYSSFREQCDLPIYNAPPFIALYWDDLHPECAGFAGYRVSTTSLDLRLVQSYIRCKDPYFTAVEALIVTFYETPVRCSRLSNVQTFQSVLATDGTSKTYLITRYETIVKSGETTAVIGDQSETVGFPHPLSCGLDGDVVVAASTVQGCPGVYVIDVTDDERITLDDLYITGTWCDYNVCPSERHCTENGTSSYACICEDSDGNCDDESSVLGAGVGGAAGATAGFICLCVLLCCCCSGDSKVSSSNNDSDGLVAVAVIGALTAVSS